MYQSNSVHYNLPPWNNPLTGCVFFNDLYEWAVKLQEMHQSLRQTTKVNIGEKQDFDVRSKQLNVST